MPSRIGLGLRPPARYGFAPPIATFDGTVASSRVGVERAQRPTHHTKPRRTASSSACPSHDSVAQPRPFQFPGSAPLIAEVHAD